MNNDLINELIIDNYINEDNTTSFIINRVFLEKHNCTFIYNLDQKKFMIINKNSLIKDKHALIVDSIITVDNIDNICQEFLAAIKINTHTSWRR